MGENQQKSVAWGVFCGLFGFFILLPLCVLIFFGVIGGCGASLSKNREDARARRQAATNSQTQSNAAFVADITAKMEQERIEAIVERNRKREAFEAAQKAAQKDRQAEIDSRLVAFQKLQATNGLPSFQFELGKRYLKGDGVEQSKPLAIYWMTKASQENADAKALLDSIR